MRIKGAVALVTGASGGIGAAVARLLADRGATVLLTGRDAGRLAALRRALRVPRGGPAAIVLPADLADRAAREWLAADAVAAFGRVDLVVHSAGVGWRGPVAAMSTPRLAELVEVNLTAPLHLTRLLLPAMIERGHGHVAFVASIAGLTGVADEAVYAATKAGLVGFAESLSLELAGSGVGCSCCSPGAVDTEFFARRGQPYDRSRPRPVSAEQVAAAVVDGIVANRFATVVPRWLGVAPRVRALAPGAYRWLARRFG